MATSDVASDVILMTIVDRLVSEFAPEEVYLVGSRARGDARADSDYDVMVVLRESDEPAYRREQRAYAAVGSVGAGKDVLVWTRAEFDARLSVPGSLPATAGARELVYPA